MPSGTDSQKKVHFSNKVDISIHKEVSIDSNHEIVKQKSIEVAEDEQAFEERVRESKIIKDFVNTLTVQSNDRNLNNNSPLPPATNKSAKMGSSSASASEIEPNRIIKKAVKMAKGKKKASKDNQQFQQLTPEYLKELEDKITKPDYETRVPENVRVQNKEKLTKAQKEIEKIYLSINSLESLNQ